MSKDPAFLFYPKDWLQGTSQMMPDEKGVYIDLLSHQHQEKDLPPETKRLARMVGLTELEFLPIWESLKSKFILTENNRLINRKLSDITTERLERGRKNKIIGTMASVFRLSPEPYDLKVEAKKTFRVDDFLTVSEGILTDTITDWFHQRLKSIANGDGNANANEDKEGGVGETGQVPVVGVVPKPESIGSGVRKMGTKKATENSTPETRLFNNMKSEWFIFYSARNNNTPPKFDGASAGALSKLRTYFLQIAKEKKSNDIFSTAFQEFKYVLDSWEKLKPDKFLYKCVDIKKINSQINDIKNFINNGRETNRGYSSSKQLGNSKTVGADELAEIFRDEVKSHGGGKKSS